MNYDIAIVGAGIIGACTAFELSKYDLSIVLLERENDVCCATSRANSAIVHAGFDPKPDTLMAKLNVRGNKLMKKYCADFDVPLINIPSIVLGFDRNDRAHIEKLLDSGIKNGLHDIRILEQDELHAMEKHIANDAQFALYAGESAIVDPMKYTIAAAELAVSNGVTLKRNFEVSKISHVKSHFILSSDSEEVSAKYIINAAGLYSDDVHRMAGGDGFHIHAVKGQYYLLDKSQGSLISSVIFRCPTEKGKGVLVAPTVYGNLIVGPDASDTHNKENVATEYDSLNFIRKMADNMVSDINFKENIRNFAGNRACCEFDDFIVAPSEQVENFINLAGIKSPGLTSAPAIAEEAAEILRNMGVVLHAKEHFLSCRKVTDINRQPFDIRQKLIKENPLYGRIICRCEGISEGEIVDALHSPIPPVSLDGVKRRCGTGTGRCQGGFCSPRVHDIICRELNLQSREVVKDKKDSYIVIGDTKEDISFD